MSTDTLVRNPTFATQTPLHIGAVGLKARDLDRLVAFYRDAIGLAVLERTSKHARLGAGGITLLELEHAPDAKPDDPRTAGLFHTAFLEPTRADLARWLVHAANTRVSLTGASDHAVSEAIYLDDPEGNGIEVYRDRLPEQWRWDGDRIHITTERLDLDKLAADAGETPYSGAPDGLRVGHIHLRVGDVATAEKFYTGAIGLDLTAGRSGAAFMSSGRYHHHVASNTWHSAGAGKREADRAGLSWFSIEAADAKAFDTVKSRLDRSGARLAKTGDGIETADPWGTRVRVTRS